MSIFMKREGVVGECSDKNHKGYVDIKSIRWGVSREITSSTSTRGDRESSNATISDLFITRRMDKSTPKLFLESCCGTGNDVEIYLTKTGVGDGSDVFMVYTLKNALFSQYKITAKNKSQGFRPLEEIKVSFSSMTLKYIQYDENNNLVRPLAVGFDTKTNTKL